MNQLGLVQTVDGFGQGVIVSPRLPTEGSMPASARRSLYRMDTFCEPPAE